MSFYPRDGVSKVQKLQMVTQKGRNVDVAAIRGNFDQAQSGVKALFEDREFAEELAAHGYQFFLLRIRSISDGWCRRSSIMCMRMPGL